jgi:uncharacterized protein (TIGR03435 family)
MRLLLLAISLVEAQPATPPSFEVASVKQQAMPGPGYIRRPWSASIQCPPPLRCGVSGNTFNEEAASLADLIMDAYSIRRFQISNLPDWGDTGRDVYTIAAKFPADAAPTLDQARRMLQTLLADRFQLRLHHETKDLPVYALVVAKSGSKLTPSADFCKGPAPPLPGGRGGPVPESDRTFLFSWEHVPEMFTQFAGRPVIDKTGFEGHYCTLEGQEPLLAVISQIVPPGGRAPAADAPGPSIFTVVGEKLGLKLEPQKGPVDVLVIDSVQRPSEN